MGRFGLESKLHDFLTGECDATTRREVEELLARDAKARALFDEIREAHEALLVLRDRPAPEAPLEKIQRSIAAGVFAGKPEPEMNAWGTRFYKRVAAAAVIVCGISLGFAAQRTWFTDPQEPARPIIAAEPPSLGGASAPGAISAFELIRKNNGKLRTRTASDAVMPTHAPDLR